MSKPPRLAAASTPRKASMQKPQNRVTVPLAKGGRVRTEAEPPASWPNGSCVCAHTGGGDRVELGRVVREGERWRVWSWSGGSHRDLGLVASQVEGISLLPDPLQVRQQAVDRVAKHAAKHAAKPAPTRARIKSAPLPRKRSREA